MASFEQVLPLIEGKAAELGVELFEARFFGSGARSVLRVTIDRAGGVSIEDCERVSVALGELLDEADFFGGKPYNLEVSSPGIDRPLKVERDFARITGRDVTLHLAAAVNGKKTVRGEVVSCADGVLVINTGAGKGKDKGTGTVNIQLAGILSGREEVRFR
ncbi:MAG: ribosome maturation factor RimP [Chitinispirillia bacterium]|nr:ribosome maturation factor RimP [Chitinispirillia bacterium]MCL2242116.1 ribosome maturation factor RimP [Chitinispirillia bacterium]